MNATITVTETLKVLICGECSIHFAMPQSKYDRCQEQGEGFYCPNGHSRIFCESENQKLRKQLEREVAEKRAAILREQLERDQKNAAQAERDRLKKRTVKNGVCPCCRRNFSSLARHMKHMHPEYTSKIK